jgi:hypothetical protein
MQPDESGVLRRFGTRRQVEPAWNFKIPRALIAYELGGRVTGTCRKGSPFPGGQRHHFKVWRVTGIGQAIGNAFAVVGPAGIYRRASRHKGALDFVIRFIDHDRLPLPVLKVDGEQPLAVR